MSNNEIILPWPPRLLSPNARAHWAARAKVSKAYMTECWALTLQSGVAVDWDGTIHLWITFYPPDRRRRDDDNIIASFKSGRDGMARALKVDDVRFRTHPLVSDETGGVIKVRLSRGVA